MVKTLVATVRPAWQTPDAFHECFAPYRFDRFRERSTNAKARLIRLHIRASDRGRAHRGEIPALLR
jgi:hypothetical protein